MQFEGNKSLCGFMMETQNQRQTSEQGEREARLAGSLEIETIFEREGCSEMVSYGWANEETNMKPGPMNWSHQLHVMKH